MLNKVLQTFIVGAIVLLCFAVSEFSSTHEMAYERVSKEEYLSDSIQIHRDSIGACVRCDTIPVIRTVEVVKEVRVVPYPLVVLSGIGVVAIILFVVLLFLIMGA